MPGSIEVRPIGSQGLQAGSLGFGAMGLTFAYGPPSKDEHSVGKLSCSYFRECSLSVFLSSATVIF